MGVFRSGYDALPGYISYLFGIKFIQEFKIVFNKVFNSECLNKNLVWVRTLVIIRPQMVDIGSEQGLSNFETATIAGYVEDFKRAKTPLWAKRCRLWMGTS